MGLVGVARSASAADAEREETDLLPAVFTARAEYQAGCAVEGVTGRRHVAPIQAGR